MIELFVSVKTVSSRIVFDLSSLRIYNLQQSRPESRRYAFPDIFPFVFHKDTDFLIRVSALNFLFERSRKARIYTRKLQQKSCITYVKVGKWYLWLSGA